jgi:hypothetical protein
MIERQHIEAILKVNGIPPTAPEEQIRSVLISSRYNNNEIDTAIMVLKENTTTNVSHVDGLHKVFRTDGGLKPDEIAKLLGINVEVTESKTKTFNSNGHISTQHYLFIWIISLIVAIVAVATYMYISDIGLFHHTSAFKFPA